MRNIWRDALESWAIPLEILSRAAESPWSHQPARFARRTKAAVAAPQGPTYERVREALPEDGTLLDVGAGTGAASLPHAARAGTIIAVDESEAMLAELPEDVIAVTGRWPDFAPNVPVADVAVCAHVAYNVPDLAPFLEALTAHARRRVVVELTDVHPMTWLNPLWKRFHDLDRPDRPRTPPPSPANSVTTCVSSRGSPSMPRTERSTTRRPPPAAASACPRPASTTWPPRWRNSACGRSSGAPG